MLNFVNSWTCRNNLIIVRIMTPQKLLKRVTQMSVSAASMKCRKDSLQEEFREGNIANNDISPDGTWKRRDYSSLNWLVTIVAIDTNQCVDFEVLLKPVKRMNRKHPNNETSKSQHDCQINHYRSAGSMEGAEPLLVSNVQWSETNYDTQLIFVMAPPALTDPLSKPIHTLAWKS